MESFGFRIHFQNPVLHVHNVYGDNILIFLRIAARSTVDHEKKNLGVHLLPIKKNLEVHFGGENV